MHVSMHAKEKYKDKSYAHFWQAPNAGSLTQSFMRTLFFLPVLWDGFLLA